MSLDFVAIDFETANASRASACAVGVAVVEDGVVTAQDGWLIRPPGRAGGFDRRNIAIHGITAADCAAHGVSWADSERRLGRFTAGRVAVAHNAPFDRSVWAAANAEAGIATPTAPFCCTLDLARRAFPTLGRPLPDYKLHTVAAALDLPPFHHHDARDDAVTAALIVLELARRARRDAMEELWPAGPKPPVVPLGAAAAERTAAQGSRTGILCGTASPARSPKSPGTAVRHSGQRPSEVRR